MKILIACIPTPGNRYLVDLKKGLEKHAQVVWDTESFWKCEEQFDVVHIHWPEYLSFELESYLYKSDPISESLWEKTKASLNYWSLHAKIIYTRHNALPHARQDEEFKKLYKTVSSYCDTIVHFANFSIQQFRNWYPELDYIKHVIIPHHNYASLPNNSDRKSARAYLGIDPNAHVMLVFGGIRQNQKKIIKRAFKYIPAKNKVLLAPKWRIKPKKFKIKAYEKMMYYLEKWFLQLDKRKKIDLGYIEEHKVHYYVNAADFLFIPRTHELNSGNIALAYTFGQLVLGKDEGDIGEILVETNNFTFNLNDKTTLKTSIKKIFLNKWSFLRNNNKMIAEQCWSVDTIAKKYLKLMR